MFKRQLTFLILEGHYRMAIGALSRISKRYCLLLYDGKPFMSVMHLLFRIETWY